MSALSDMAQRAAATSATDNINRPAHYQGDHGIECIQAIIAQMTGEEYSGYLRGNIVKYVWRYRAKGGKESLLKARWYLDRLIEVAG